MTTLPAIKLIKDVLDGLLGKDVAVKPSDNAFDSTDAVGGALATYIDDSNAMWAVVGWDLSAGANVGASVALVPPGAAEDAIDEKYLADNLLENLGEVSNVLASVFQISDNPHLRLEQMYRPVNMASDDAVNLLYALGNRVDLDIDVPGYGAGKFALSMRFS